MYHRLLTSMTMTRQRQQQQQGGLFRSRCSVDSIRLQFATSLMLVGIILIQLPSTSTAFLIPSSTSSSLAFSPAITRTASPTTTLSLIPLPQPLTTLPSPSLAKARTTATSTTTLYAKKKKKKKNIQDGSGNKIICVNRSARRNYEILSTLEVGISLYGTEVKSIRDGKMNIRDGWIKPSKNGRSCDLMNVHIGKHSFTGSYDQHDERRPRTLLLHKEESRKFKQQIEQNNGMT